RRQRARRQRTVGAAADRGRRRPARLAAKRLGRSARRRRSRWGAAGSVVSGGLNELLKRLQQNGLGDPGQSWVGHGPNQPVTPDSLERAAGADTLDALARET